ncbi:DUF1330 domain-containing protein [Kitasatospora sp. GP82]|uniref:DUF1330 domain-containing protein n=1 Tax=Kitasatospora sp. GP82 TaxID=3035089 RepID=UPI0024763231|nr:DUF1330 domain-containing protein [Kitasatospora sp. GP82]MDH6128117.1 uncharacterized protein (DUF1330 family) [Kitasatospora sp. GP82]
MPAYAVAVVHRVEHGPDIVEYLERIDATLKPFSGRFMVHGGEVEPVEGSWKGDLIVIRFPDRDHVRGWYDSPAYQAILKLRTDHMTADVFFADGVPADYEGADKLRK